MRPTTGTRERLGPTSDAGRDGARAPHGDERAHQDVQARIDPVAGGVAAERPRRGDQEGGPDQHAEDEDCAFGQGPSVCVAVITLYGCGARSVTKWDLARGKIEGEEGEGGHA